MTRPAKSAERVRVKAQAEIEIAVDVDFTDKNTSLSQDVAQAVQDALGHTGATVHDVTDWEIV